MTDAAILDRVKARIGWESEPRTELIEAGQVRRFCEAIGDPDPRWLNEVPPTFVVTLSTDLPEIPEALEYGQGWLNGGDRFEYFEPIRIGDQITSRLLLRDVYEKQGSSGSLLFLVLTTEFVNQQGRLAVRVTGTRIRR